MTRRGRITRLGIAWSFDDVRFESSIWLRHQYWSESARWQLAGHHLSKKYPNKRML